MWSINLIGGGYIPKNEHKVIREDELVVEEEWWFKRVWKFKCPLKARNFMGMVISQKVPTWDNMQKLIRNNLGRCFLCMVSEKNRFHYLFIVLLLDWVGEQSKIN